MKHHPLMHRFLDGELAPDEATEFEAWLLRDQENLDQFVQLSILDRHLHRTLARLHRQQSILQHGRHRVQQPAKGSPPRKHLAYLAAAAIVLGIAVLMSVLLTYAWNRHDRLTRPVQHFATLINARDAVFEHSDVPTSPGSQLPGGFLRLASGAVDIEFFSGAQVTVTGPATFGINAEKRGYLERGKITAYCPPQARGFTVGAPGVAIVDLGTRFSMSVSDEGTTDVQVIEGLVAVSSVDFDGRVKATRELTASTAARIRNDQITDLPFTESVYRDSTRHAPTVLAHYDFTVARTTSAPRPAGMVAVNATAGPCAPYLNGAASTRSDADGGMAFSGLEKNAYVGGQTLAEGLGDDYWQLSIDASDGYVIHFSTMTFDWKLTNMLSGSVTYTLRSSIDGYAADLGAFTTTRNGSGAAVPISLAGLAPQSDPVTFRIYNGAAPGSTFGDGGQNAQMRVDNIMITGTVRPVTPLLRERKD